MSADTRRCRLGWVLLTLGGPVWAQTPPPVSGSTSQPEEEYKIYTEAPRLFLRAQRMRLLKRERERTSLRWEPFQALAANAAQLPETGFAAALYYAVSGDAAAGRRAVAWAAAPANRDPRQLAVVYDWCAPLWQGQQKAAVEAKLKAVLAAGPASPAAKSGPASVGMVRDQLLAAVALADTPALSTPVVEWTVKVWWRQQMAPLLRQGKPVVRREDVAALFEILHVLRDNNAIDLREDATGWFKSLPVWHLLSHYPAPYPAPENEYRIPAYTAAGDPDLKVAAQSRVAELMMVAYDPNAVESQYLQGWLLQDRFLLRGPYGLPYEFLWANPYQPGLPYQKMEPFFHDPLGGKFFVRSSWEEDANWLGLFDGQLQWFANGEVKVLKPGAVKEPLPMGAATILPVGENPRFAVKSEDAVTYFLMGLTPRAAYDVEIDDEEMYEAQADAGGVLMIAFGAKTDAGVRLTKRP
jgi:hypothetical protein